MNVTQWLCHRGKEEQNVQEWSSRSFSLVTFPVENVLCTTLCFFYFEPLDVLVWLKSPVGSLSVSISFPLRWSFVLRILMDTHHWGNHCAHRSGSGREPVRDILVSFSFPLKDSHTTTRLQWLFIINMKTLHYYSISRLETRFHVSAYCLFFIIKN